jgi:hypothetical protein
MAVTVFSVGDKDYLTKLNTMSQQAGDVQQAKTDAEQAVVDAQTEVTNAANEKLAAQQAKADAQAIAVGDLNWSVANAGRALVNGDSILFDGSVETVYPLPATIAAGHQFYLKNIGTANVAIPASTTISITDGTITANNGDRVITEPGDDISLIALDAAKLRIL